MRRMRVSDGKSEVLSFSRSGEQKRNRCYSLMCVRPVERGDQGNLLRKVMNPEVSGVKLGARRPSYVWTDGVKRKTSASVWGKRRI